MPIIGRVWKYGANVDTDLIIAGRYCNMTDAKDLGAHCMEDLDPSFSTQVRAGDIIVADSNFGCGSSREVAPVAIKGAGVSAVIAANFARIFYRNAINIGLPIFESPEAAAAIEQGHRVEIDPAAGVIHDLDTDQKFRSAPFPEFMQMIMDRGGLLGYVEERLAQQKEGAMMPKSEG
ncbi:MAG: 3-isopropylmalate dehydratase small subunit [Chloroflexi bacterium]|nr:3-isopropylmalate dehydratase small subunit [Chloroflexota bacterium]